MECVDLDLLLIWILSQAQNKMKTLTHRAIARLVENFIRVSGRKLEHHLLSRLTKVPPTGSFTF